MKIAKQRLSGLCFVLSGKVYLVIRRYSNGKTQIYTLEKYDLSHDPDPDIWFGMQFLLCSR